MSRRWDRLLRSGAPVCTSGKRGFADELTAARQLQAARLHRRDRSAAARIPGRVERSYYRCPSCTWWHLCSSTGPRRRGDYDHRHGHRG